MTTAPSKLHCPLRQRQKCWLRSGAVHRQAAPAQLVLVRVGTNVVAVGVIAAAAAAVVVGTRCCSTYRCGTHRCGTVAAAVRGVAVAPAAHSHSAAPSTSNGDSAAAVAASVKSATAPIAATSATAGIGIVRDETGGEQNDCCKRSKNIAKHDNLPTNFLEQEDCGARSARG